MRWIGKKLAIKCQTEIQRCATADIDDFSTVPKIVGKKVNSKRYFIQYPKQGKIGKRSVSNSQVNNNADIDRTPRQVKEHYFNYLKPDINKSDWSIEDDMQLIGLINENGLNWKLIIEKMNGRTENQIKNQYFGKILKLSNKKQAQSATLTLNQSQVLQSNQID